MGGGAKLRWGSQWAEGGLIFRTQKNQVISRQLSLPSHVGSNLYYWKRPLMFQFLRRPQLKAYHWTLFLEVKILGN